VSAVRFLCTDCESTLSITNPNRLYCMDFCWCCKHRIRPSPRAASHPAASSAHFFTSSSFSVVAEPNLAFPCRTTEVATMASLTDIVPSGVITGDDVLTLFEHARANAYAVPAVNCTRCVACEEILSLSLRLLVLSHTVLSSLHLLLRLPDICFLCFVFL
jgi:hypothetical protein